MLECIANFFCLFWNLNWNFIFFQPQNIVFHPNLYFWLFISHFRHLFTLQIIVTLNRPYIPTSLHQPDALVHHMIRIMLPNNSFQPLSAACMKYDESIKMLNVTDSWEFGFNSPKGNIWVTFIMAVGKELRKCHVSAMISFVVRRLTFRREGGWMTKTEWTDLLFFVFD